jgi:tetratricopeptide (TPR) repeat protein
MQLVGPTAALPLFEEALVKVEKFAFGAHRWRWGNHLSACLAEALLGTGSLAEALRHADRGIEQARATGSMKYLGRCLALRGEILLREGQRPAARDDLAEGLRISRQIGYPTLTWQAAHGLALALAGENANTGRTGDRAERVQELVQLAAGTIESVAERAPDAALRRTFLGWSRVQDALEDLERLRRL